MNLRNQKAIQTYHDVTVKRQNIKDDVLIKNILNEDFVKLNRSWYHVFYSNISKVFLHKLS